MDRTSLLVKGASIVAPKLTTRGKNRQAALTAKLTRQYEHEVQTWESAATTAYAGYEKAQGMAAHYRGLLARLYKHSK